MKTLLCLLLTIGSLHAESLVVIKGKVWPSERLNRMRTDELTQAGVDRIVGRIIQITPRGALVSVGSDSTRERFSTVFLSGVSGKVDGEQAAYYCEEAGVFEYTTVLGARNTVRNFEIAFKPTEDQVKKYEFLRQLDERAREEAAEKSRQEAAKNMAEAQQKAEADKLARLAAVKATADAKQFAVDKKGSDFWHKKAEAGEALGQYEFALRLLVGKGVTRDEHEARRLMELAAKQGHAKAAEWLKFRHKPATNPQPAKEP